MEFFNEMLSILSLNLKLFFRHRMMIFTGNYKNFIHKKKAL